MSLSSRLTMLRKQRGLTQQAMAEAIGIHINSLKKYESDQADPSAEVLKKIAVTLRVSTDFLLFEDDERHPDELSGYVEAINRMQPQERLVVKEVLESLILKYQLQSQKTTTLAAAKANKGAQPGKGNAAKAKASK
jgi:transcriptional regulator with XRE-family HTH domain